MTGVEVILAAVVAGTGAGVSDAAKTAVVDAFVNGRDAKGVQVGDHNTQHNTFS